MKDIFGSKRIGSVGSVQRIHEIVHLSLYFTPELQHLVFPGGAKAAYSSEQ